MTHSTKNVMKKFLIINNGLHRIGIVLGFFHLIFGPPLFYNNFNSLEYFWLAVIEDAFDGELLIVITIGPLFAMGLFLSGYLTVKIIEWIYMGFNKKDS